MKYRIYALDIGIYNKEIWIEKLEKLSLKGWILERIIMHYGIFKKAVPKKRNYSIELFYPNKKAEKSFGNRLLYEEEKEKYIEYCEEAGWNYIANFGNYMIMYSEVQDVLEIQTDAEIQKIQMKEEFIRHSIPNLVLWFFYIHLLTKNQWMFSRNLNYNDLLSCVSIIFIPWITSIFICVCLPLIGDIFYLITRENKKYIIMKSVFYIRKWIFNISFILIIGTLIFELYYKKVWAFFEMIGIIFVCIAMILFCIFLWKKLKIEEKKLGLQMVFSSIVILSFFFIIMGIAYCFDKNSIGKDYDEWKADVTIQSLIGNGETSFQEKIQSPFLEAFYYQGEGNDTTLRYVIYKRKHGNQIMEKALIGELETLETMAKRWNGSVQSVEKENWGAKKSYGIISEKWDFIVERRLLLNNDYAISIYIYNQNGNKINLDPIIKQMREQIIEPLKNGKEKSVIG